MVKLVGSASDETLSGGIDDDILRGKKGHDLLIGAQGNDLLRGGGGKDTLEGGEGHDTLFGGGGRDTLDGGEGNDTMNGGNGNDLLVANGGVDTMTGGAGADTYRFTTDAAQYFQGTGPDMIAQSFPDAHVITDFEDGIDKIDISDFDVVNNAIGLSTYQDGADTQVALFDYQTFTAVMHFTLEDFQAGDLTADDFVI